MAVLIGSNVLVLQSGREVDVIESVVIESVDGELVDSFRDCIHCGGRHPIIDGCVQSCCCDFGDHDVEYCCECGHYGHDGGDCPGAHCGDYRCCQP